MRILLPPSEAKTSGGRGRSLAARSTPGPLAPARATALDALDALLAGDPDLAATSLLLPPGVAAAALAANASVRTSATVPALRRYAGVVYDGLGFDQLSPTAQRIAARSVLVFSGLLGVVRGDEAVPSYRVPAKATLPGIGVVGTFWRPVLDVAMPSLLGRGLVVDLRSGDYAAMWRPDPKTAERTVTVRILSPLPRSGHGVISYPSKYAKGLLTAALVTRLAEGGTVATAEDVAAAWLSSGEADARPGKGNELVLYTAWSTRVAAH